VLNALLRTPGARNVRDIVIVYLVVVIAVMVVVDVMVVLITLFYIYK
jgi:hypothetical protein